MGGEGVSLWASGGGKRGKEWCKKGGKGSKGENTSLCAGCGGHFDAPGAVEDGVGHVCVDAAGHAGGIAFFVDEGEGDGVGGNGGDGPRPI